MFHVCLFFVLISNFQFAFALSCPIDDDLCELNCKSTHECKENVVDGSDKVEFSVYCAGESSCLNARFIGLHLKNTTKPAVICSHQTSCKSASFISLSSSFFKCDGM